MVVPREEKLPSPLIVLLKVLGLHKKKTTFWRWLTFPKFKCELNWLHLAAVTVGVDRPDRKELWESPENSWDPVLAQRWLHLGFWMTQQQSSSWTVSMSTFMMKKVPANLLIGPWSGWEITALLMFPRGLRLCWLGVTWPLTLPKKGKLGLVFAEGCALVALICKVLWQLGGRGGKGHFQAGWVQTSPRASITRYTHGSKHEQIVL